MKISMMLIRYFFIIMPRYLFHHLSINQLSARDPVHAEMSTSSRGLSAAFLG